MSDVKAGVKAEVRALLDRLPEDCSYADVQRGIAVLMWPKQGDGSLKPPERLDPEEVKRRRVIGRQSREKELAANLRG